MAVHALYGAVQDLVSVIKGTGLVLAQETLNGICGSVQKAGALIQTSNRSALSIRVATETAIYGMVFITVG